MLSRGIDEHTFCCEESLGDKRYDPRRLRETCESLSSQTKESKKILTKPRQKVIKRKELCGLSALEVLDIALTSLDSGRDCGRNCDPGRCGSISGCGAVCGGCSNVWDSMMRVKGRQRNLSPRGCLPNKFEFRVDGKFTHAIQIPCRRSELRSVTRVSSAIHVQNIILVYVLFRKYL